MHCHAEPACRQTGLPKGVVTLSLSKGIVILSLPKDDNHY
jgi:hypothetical protein